MLRKAAPASSLGSDVAHAGNWTWLDADQAECLRRHQVEATLGVSTWEASVRLLLSCPAILLLGGCACGYPDASPNYVTTRASLATAAAPTSQIGESCEAHGKSDCLTGFCLAVKTVTGSSHVCTVPCSTDADCSVGWNCGTVAPRTRACLPGTQWRFGPATARARLPSGSSGADAGFAGTSASEAFPSDGGQ